MHTDEAALLAAVCAAPGDDLPRLVYADWCDEQGRHIRADFIRSQVEMTRLEEWFRQFTTRDERKANGPEFGRRLSFLRKRVGQLLNQHPAQATGVPDHVRPLLVRMGTERGFLCAITIDAADVNRMPDWLGEVVVPGGEVAVAHLGYHLTPDTDHPLRDPTAWSQVTHLRLHDYSWNRGRLPHISPDHLARLAQAPLPRVTRVEFDHCRLTDAHAVVLATQYDFPALRMLTLCGNLLTPVGVRALCNAPWWAGLHELSLSCSPPVRELVDVLTTARIPGLRSLTIGNNHELSGRVGEQLYGELIAAYPNTVIEIN